MLWLNGLFVILTIRHASVSKSTAGTYLDEQSEVKESRVARCAQGLSDTGTPVGSNCFRNLYESAVIIIPPSDLA